LRQAASWLFVSQGRAEEQLKWGGLGSVAIIVGYLVGIFWGPKGIAMSAAISSAAIQIPMMWWAVTRCGPVTRADAIRLVVPIAVATAISGGLLALAAREPVWSSLPALVLAAILAYALFIGALALFPDGRAQLSKAAGIVRRLKRR